MASGSRDVTRRTFDVASAERRASERCKRENKVTQMSRHAHIDGDPFAPTRAWLQKREGRVLDFESKIGDMEIVAGIGGGGFECKECGVVVKDSNRYLMHVNSRKHQKNLGVSMRVKRSSVADVEEAFEKVKRERERERGYGDGGGGGLKERIERRKKEAKEKRRAAAEKEGRKENM